MRISHAIFSLTVLCLPSLVCAAQSPVNATPTQAEPPAQATPPSPVVPSGLLKPSLDTVQQTVGEVKLDKWKRGNIREEAGDNIGKIQRDVKEILPPMLSDADAAPGAVSKMLPVAKNAAALYDVLLRVVEAARVSAPGEQVAPLQEALISLGNARLALDSRMQDAAMLVEKQVSDLQVTVQKQAALKCPAPPVPVAKPCVPPTPHRARKKPAPPTTTPKTTTPQKPAAQTTPKTGP